MDFQLSEEQVLLREALAGTLARLYAFDDRKAALEAEGWRRDVWTMLAGELGLFAAAEREEHGGLGGGAVDVMVIAEEMGRANALEPWLECVVLAGGLLRDVVDVDNVRTGMIDGSLIVAPALFERAARSNPHRIACRFHDGALNGEKTAVVAAPFASHLIVSARDGAGEAGLYLVEATANGLERRDYRLVDGRPAADVTFADTPAKALQIGAGARTAIDRALDAALAAQCAEAIGVMTVLLDRTVAYTKQREQFGRPIATFQVLQHRMADMAVAIERSRSMAVMAALAIDGATGGNGQDRTRLVAAAKAYVADALRLVAEGAVQLHGGIGTTDEIDVSHYFKRAFVLQQQFGTAQYHLARMADLDA
ncbi:acyl-CoA dehydrogenase family protein [Novosphingobium olei]|nr:acyl-CoA dehydrogenase family protein [Novosphingobium olei]